MSHASVRPPEGDASGTNYWSDKLAGRPPALELPTSRARPAQPTTQRPRLGFKLSAELSRSFRAFLQREGMSAFDGMLAVWAALLYRTTRQHDLLIGLCEDGSYAALRLALENRPSFRELLDRLRRELSEGRANALELPLLLKAAHSTRADNLFQVLVTSDKVTAEEAQGYDLVFAPGKTAKGALSGALFYDSELFDPRVAERMVGH